MLPISLWQVLMFLIAFLSLKLAKNEGKLGIIHGKARLKLNYMKNPSFGELLSLCQINQVCKEDNQRRNLTLKNFVTTCKIFIRQKEISQQLLFHLRNFRNSFYTCKNFATPFQHCENFATPFPLAKFLQLHIWLAKSSCNLQIFCTDFVRFLPQDILCNYLFSPCNQLKIFLDIGYLIEGLKISLFIYLKISLFVISISESRKTFLEITCTFF